jgi:parallel beta-helix repeat protein
VLDEASVSAAPTTRYVGGNGTGNYSNIMGAVNVANPGDTIRVFPGTYYGSFQIDKSISLIGSGKNNTIIDGSLGNVLTITSDWVNVSGFGLRDIPEDGIELNNVSNCTISDCNISGTPSSYIKVGISIESSLNNKINNNSIGYAKNGIILSSSTNNIFQNNTINDYEHTGFYFFENSYDNNVPHSNIVNGIAMRWYSNLVGSYDHHIIIDDISVELSDQNNIAQIYLCNCEYLDIINSTIKNGTKGIMIQSSSFITVSNNHCSNNVEEGIIITGSNNTITSNLCSNNGEDGIYADGSDCTIIENICLENTGNGIYVGENGFNYYILDNNCSGNAKDGIKVEVSFYKFENNTCYSNNGYGICLKDVSNKEFVENIGGGLYLKGSNNTISHQIFLNSGASSKIHMYGSNNKIIQNKFLKCGSAGSIRMDGSDNSFIENTCVDDSLQSIGIIGSHNIVSNINCKIISVNGNNNMVTQSNCEKMYIERNNNKVTQNNCEYIDIYSNNNIITQNSGKYIDIYSGNNNMVTQNNHGIYVGGNNNIISSNNCSNKGGIELWGDSNTINRNTCNSNEYGIYIQGYNNIITNNICNYNKYNKERECGGFGIEFDGFDSDNNIIENNTCSFNEVDGILIDGSNNIIKNNTLSMNRESGIYLAASNNIIKNNTLSMNQESGIYIAASINTINNNIISMNGYGIHIYSADDNIFSNNIISENHKDGIYLELPGWASYWQCDFNTFINNTISLNGGNGIHIKGECSDNKFEYNNISSNVDSGIWLISANNNRFNNNIISLNAGSGILIYNAYWNRITQNVISNNGKGINLHKDAGGNTIHHNYFFKNKFNTYFGYDDDTRNKWDDGSEGNFWDDYIGEDSDGDGIGDIPYQFSDEKDNFPIMGFLANLIGFPIVSKGEEIDFGQYDKTYADETIISKSWDFDNSDGIQEDAVGDAPKYTYSTIGIYTVTLNVSSSLGFSTTDALTTYVIDEILFDFDDNIEDVIDENDKRVGDHPNIDITAVKLYKVGDMLLFEQKVVGSIEDGIIDSNAYIYSLDFFMDKDDDHKRRNDAEFTLNCSFGKIELDNKITGKTRSLEAFGIGTSTLRILIPLIYINNNIDFNISAWAYHYVGYSQYSKSYNEIFIDLITGPNYMPDTDDDGYLDDIDAFPDDPNEWNDTDNDGFGDNTDAFPSDPTQWSDMDNDNYGDNPQGNNPDLYPDDPTRWEKHEKTQKEAKNNWIAMALIITIIIVIVIILVLIIIKKRRKQEQYDQDVFFNNEAKVRIPQQITQSFQSLQPTPTPQAPTTQLNETPYQNLEQSEKMTFVTREAAIETQYSLDHKMAQLEMEIQESMKRQPSLPTQPQKPQPTPSHQMTSIQKQPTHTSHLTQQPPQQSQQLQQPSQAEPSPTFAPQSQSPVDKESN